MDIRTEPGDLLLRPVFMLDRGVFLSYAPYIRRILVGLAGTAQAAALVGPPLVETESILYPSVEWIEHPALRLPVFGIQNRRILLDRLFRFKPTVLHTFHPGMVPLAGWLSRQLQIPYVVTFHAEPAPLLKLDQHPCGAISLIAPSESIAERLEKKWPALKTRIRRIHVGAFVEDSCACFSRSGSVTSLIATHPLNKLKLFLPLLNAVRHLVLDGHELFVALMGTGSAEKSIRAHIRRLGLSSIVTVVPPIRPVRNILNGADIYLHLEDLGMFDAQLLEAMAVGLGVVGAPDKTSGLLQSRSDSAVWDGRDELSIYSSLKQVFSNKDGTRRDAMTAQDRLRSSFSVSEMIARLIETYLDAQRFYRGNCLLALEPSVNGTQASF
ncbi:MAG: glycosyltransferase [Planctomycetaceae bacterium]|nr:glycosyltransferase [Planctomycetaceae bacterium]